MGKKFKRNSGGKGKRNKKLWIIGVAAVMVFSGLFYGMYSSEPAVKPADAGANITTVKYTIEPVGNQSGLVEISQEVKQLVLMPNDPGALYMENLEQIAGLNTTSIIDVVLESTNAYMLFRFNVRDTKKAELEINENINLPGGYKVYGVYRGTASGMDVDVIGQNLTTGDRVNARLFQASDSQFSLIGFAQSS